MEANGRGVRSTPLPKSERSEDAQDTPGSPCRILPRVMANEPWSDRGEGLAPLEETSAPGEGAFRMSTFPRTLTDVFGRADRRPPTSNGGWIPYGTS